MNILNNIDWSIETPTTTCRNSSCSNFVNKVYIKELETYKHNFYCVKHLRCGTLVEDGGSPCEGCLMTFQEDWDKFLKEEVEEERKEVKEEEVNGI
jgi:hypothetical protein